MLDNILENEFFWSFICLILSIAAHLHRKRLLKSYIEEKNTINQIEKENPDVNVNLRKNYNEHVLKSKINVLYFSRWVIFLGALFVFLRAIGIVPPAE